MVTNKLKYIGPLAYTSKVGERQKAANFASLQNLEVIQFQLSFFPLSTIITIYYLQIVSLLLVRAWNFRDEHVNKRNEIIQDFLIISRFIFCSLIFFISFFFLFLLNLSLTYAIKLIKMKWEKHHWVIWH